VKAIYREHGSPPPLLTYARQNARAGGKVLVDLLYPLDFADLATITTDWEGDGFTPVLNIFLVKFFIGNPPKRLTVEWNISLEDAFGMDNFDNGVLRQIVFELKNELEEKTAAGPPRWN